MDFRTIAAAVRRGWWILAIAAGAGVLTGAVASGHSTPEYTATTRLFIAATGGNSSSEAFTGGQFAEQRAESYSQIITSEQITARVVDDLHLPTSAHELSGRVTAAIVPRTVLMDVSATDASPERAAAIANSLAHAFIGYAQPLETPAGQSTPRATISVVSPADVPVVPSSPNVMRNLAYGLIGGLAIGLLVLTLMRVLSRRIASPEQLRQITGAPTMGPVTTPGHAADVGRHRLVDWVPEEAEQLRRLRVHIEAHDPPPQVLLVAPVSAGGAAASVGAGLALAFAETGESTALVAVDRAPALSHGLGPDAAGLAELLTGRATYEDGVHATACPHLQVVPSGGPADLESLLSSASMSSFLDDLRKDCDRVVMVVPPVTDSSAASVLSAIVDADLLIVDKSTHRGQLARALGELKSARAHLLGVVPTK